MCTNCEQDDCACESIALDVIEGQDGDDGASNYQLWLDAGNTGSLADYLASLEGADGMSAYEQWLDAGNTGTFNDFLDSISGNDGDPGDDGTNGINAFTLLGASFVAPLVGSTVMIACAAPETFLWAGVGQPVFITQAGHYRVVTQGDTSLVVENLGHSTNAAPGTQIPDPLVLAPQIQCSPDGEIGEDGEDATGLTGAAGQLPVQDTIPAGTPAAGTSTRIYRDNTDPSNPIFWLYTWDGASWVNQGRISGAAGARILYPGANPNSMPALYGNVGDTAVEDVSTSGQVKYWTKVNNTPTWTLQISVSGSLSGTSSGEMYRVGKAAPQPIPMGTTDPTYIQFEVWTGGGLNNGGWWNGSAYNGETGISSTQRYILENLRIYSAGSETIDFDIDILVKTVSEANGVISITSPADEGELAVLSTGDQSVDDTVVVQVAVTPSANPTVQWYIDFSSIVFYNQT